MHASSTLIVSLFVAAAWSQDLDTAVSANGRKPFTFLDQIENPEERSAFLSLSRERNPPARLKQANVFLERYPQSWLLAQVYEAAAKAAIDLNDLSAANRFAVQSLALLPENPLLLVPMANVQVQLKRYKDAEGMARDALELLDRFGRPSSVPEKEWHGTLAALRASARYVLGRVAAIEGISASGAKRIELLARSAALLEEARAENPSDPEFAFLLGVVQRQRGESAAAAGQFASAARVPGPLQSRAQAQLREMNLEGAPPAAPAVRPLAKPPASRMPGYAGSAACQGCHPAQFAAWRETGMAKMLAPFRPENVIGEFDGRELDAAQGSARARVWSEGSERYFATRLPAGAWQRHRVDFTIGSKWQQAYATRLPDGQIHVFPLQYNRLEKAWINYWRVIDPPGSERPRPELFHRMDLGTNYQVNCAPCHTSQLGSRSTKAAAPQDLEFREAGVNCEMCHGPSADHVMARRAGREPGTGGKGLPVSFRSLDSREYVRICAQCHAQSAMRDLGPGGEYNYAATGGSFARTYPSRPFAEFSRRAFYPDGRFRETTFIAEALQRTACYRKGGAHCGSCHEVHPADAKSNPVSLKFRDRPDQMCLQCHQKFSGAIERHTRHAAAAEASRCVSCHMPKILNSVLFQARTHQIDDIPRSALTVRFGRENSPNACLLCHANRDDGWLQRATP